jgi:predicted DNA-binding transcriptional regulator YafY
MDIKAKLRPFYVAKMLYEQTDEEHYLTIAQIIDQLNNQYGISTSRGTVGDDIKVLQEFGLEIEVEQSTQNRYYLIGRRFDLPELKALIDAVESARFIPTDKSSALVSKLSLLASPFVAPNLVRNVDVENRIKADNEKVYYIMEALNDAINDKKKVSFQYYTYNRNKERVAKHDGEVYVFSPYKMIWNGDYYYVVGYSEKHGNVGSFRVDRIVTTPQILSEEQQEPPKDFDLNIYLNSMFRMYNGERKQIELVCDNELMDSIIDRFGNDVNVSVYDANSFKANVTTSVGNVFYCWIFGFGGRVTINSPEDVKEEYAEMVAAAVAAIEK